MALLLPCLRISGVESMVYASVVEGIGAEFHRKSLNKLFEELFRALAGVFID